MITFFAIGRSMTPIIEEPNKSLAIVTCYFNPCHYKSRKKNYLLFARGMQNAGVKLRTVELAFGDDPFELEPNTDIIQLRTPHVMWQKERLLMIGIESLAQQYSEIGWFDCDVLFASTDWPQRLSELLKRNAFVQCFRDVVLLPSGAEMVQPDGPRRFGAVYYFLNTGRLERAHTGYAWAARRELLDKHRLYDAHILGAADLSMAYALMNQGDILQWTKEMNAWDWFRSMNKRMTEHLESWMLPFSEDIRGNVGYLDETIYPLFHGELGDRFYAERVRILRDFDPFVDIAIGPNKCWHWASEKIELHQNVKDYFSLRAEDGDAQQ